MDEQANTMLVKQAYDAFAHGDIPRLMSLCDQNLDWEIVEVPGAQFTGKRHGHSEVMDFFRILSQEENMTEFTPREFIAQGDRVIVLGHSTATVKATNAQYETDWIQVFTVRNGMICSFYEMLDSCAAAQAFGQLSLSMPGDIATQRDAGRPSIH
jgi:uncharacterized protein